MEMASKSGPEHEGLVEFREVQRFHQTWLWSLLILADAGIIVFFGHALVEQVVLDRAWGARPLSDAALLWTGLGAMAFALGVTVLIYAMRLVTEVRSEGLHLRFLPFRSRLVRYEDIHGCEAVSYRPLADYGGWGIRYGRQGKALTVKGNRGVLLDMVEGRRLLIGSQRADELASHINRHLAL